MQTLGQMLCNAAHWYGEKPFLIYKNKVTTYKEFYETVCRLSNLLQEAGVKKGDSVGLYLPSTPELVLGYHACQQIGACAIPMSSKYRYREVENIARKTGFEIVITTQDNYPIIKELQNQLESIKTVFVAGDDVQEGCVSMQTEMQKHASDIQLVNYDLEDVAVTFFTSGTTGGPKGAMQTHRSIYSFLNDMTSFLKFRYKNEVILSVLPVFNNFGATVCMNAVIYHGGTLVLLEHWDTEEVLTCMSRHRATFFAGTPTMFSYLLQNYDPNKYDLSSLRLALSAGALMPSEVHEQFEMITGIKLVQAYGATETSGFITCEPVVGVKKPGSVGIPIGSCTILIKDDTGKELPPEQVGEIIIQGDTLGVGYWGDPDATNLAFKQGCWFSGDLGKVDHDGFVYIVDRKKDVIITGGSNIYPSEVEEVLYSHPNVEMAAVVGVPDPVKGELAKAIIVVKAGASLLQDELEIFCQKRLANYKVPKSFEFIEQMPLGPTGKILKRELREWVTANKNLGVKI